ncbi:hypothetical protein OIO90_000707 [Microbotryomycetes sp. JL221]|nr:hypothetical protein OIO90_000707 [Microbotryomycetes sp. JL221]
MVLRATKSFSGSLKTSARRHSEPRAHWAPAQARQATTASSSRAPRQVKIVEVGPRDGLQNEKQVLSTELKVGLIDKLIQSGLRTVEAGSFVSPKWVPQMASTTDVLSSPTLRSWRDKLGEDLSLPVLVPNAKGLSSMLSLLDSQASSSPHPITNEMAVFIAASEGFSKANINTTVQGSLDILPPLFEKAKQRGIKVRAYVSVVLGCPFDGKVDKQVVADVTKSLIDMGAYEVSLGDTIGVGTPDGWEDLLNVVTKKVAIEKLAAHCHDTYGSAVANVLRCVELGIPTVDSSISALGGCPYSPGATGNVSTEDVVYALESSGLATTSLLPPVQPGQDVDDLLDGGERGQAFEKLAEVGRWVSQELGRSNGSKAGEAVLRRRERRQNMQDKAKAKL